MQIFCLHFPNRQFECETMSLAGICWNMMASSVFPYVFVLLRQRSEDMILGRNHDWYLTAYKNIEICLKIFRNPQKRPLNGL